MRWREGGEEEKRGGERGGVSIQRAKREGRREGGREGRNGGADGRTVLLLPPMIFSERKEKGGEQMGNGSACEVIISTCSSPTCGTIPKKVKKGIPWIPSAGQKNTVRYIVAQLGASKKGGLCAPLPK